jgi:hypothetical protein
MRAARGVSVYADQYPYPTSGSDWRHSVGADVGIGGEGVNAGDQLGQLQRNRGGAFSTRRDNFKRRLQDQATRPRFAATSRTRLTGAVALTRS